MEIRILDNHDLGHHTKSFLTGSGKPFVCFEGLRCSFNLTQGNGNPSAEAYLQKVKSAADQYYMEQGHHLAVTFRSHPLRSIQSAVVFQIDGFLMKKRKRWIKGLKLRLELSVLCKQKFPPNLEQYSSSPTKTPLPIISKDIQVASWTDHVTGCIKIRSCNCDIGYQFKTVAELLPIHVFEHTESFDNLLVLVSLALVCGEDDLGNQDKFQFCRRMLTEGLHSDFVIVSGDGSKIPCHKSFLAASSPVLAAMLSSEMEETRRGRIIIEEISTEGVNALLSYIYTGDTTKPKESSKVALELLEASHKYNILLLEQKMRNFFLSKPDSWIETDILLDVFVFVRNASGSGYDNLKEKVAEIMRLHSCQLRECELYQDSLKDDREIAAILGTGLKKRRE